MNAREVYAKAIVAIIAIFIILFLVVKSSGLSFVPLSTITGNAVYKTTERPYDHVVRTASTGFYQNTGGNAQQPGYGLYEYGYGEKAGGTEWDGKRDIYQQNKLAPQKKGVDLQDINDFNYLPTNIHQAQTDFILKGKIYLQKTYNVYPEFGEINMIVDLYDEEGVDRITYDVYGFEKGAHANGVVGAGKFSLQCNGKKNCRTSYIYARNVRNFFQVFEDKTVNVIVKDSAGNVKKAVLNAENNWMFEFK